MHLFHNFNCEKNIVALHTFTICFGATGMESGTTWLSKNAFSTSELQLHKTTTKNNNASVFMIYFFFVLFFGEGKSTENFNSFNLICEAHWIEHLCTLIEQKRPVSRHVNKNQTLSTRLFLLLLVLCLCVSV